MIKTKNQAMLEGLRRLKAKALDVNKRRRFGGIGICQALDEALMELHNERLNPSDPYVMQERWVLWQTYANSTPIINATMREWPEYSGNTMYPVPSLHKGMSPAAAYTRFDKWSRRTKYGKARWRLLEHCIAYFEAKVTEERVL